MTKKTAHREDLILSLLSLIEGANAAGSPVNRARCAVAACRMISDHELLILPLNFLDTDD
jgi:hypothetical protein